MSAGLILANGLFGALTTELSPVKAAIPSITINGNELKLIELTPRIRITGGLFNTPLGIETFTPAAWPPRPCSKLWLGALLNFSPSTVAIDPLKSRFACVP